MRLASAVTCCLSVDTLQEYRPECSTVVSLRVNSVTYTELLHLTHLLVQTQITTQPVQLPLFIHLDCRAGWYYSGEDLNVTCISTVSAVFTWCAVKSQHSNHWSYQILCVACVAMPSTRFQTNQSTRMFSSVLTCAIAFPVNVNIITSTSPALIIIAGKVFIF